MCLDTFREYSSIQENNFKKQQNPTHIYIYIHTKCLLGVSIMRSCEKQEIQLVNADELASDALTDTKCSLVHE